MSDWPYKGATQREHDIAAYGYCWCGEPRHSVVLDDPDSPSGKIITMRCYNEDGHQLTLDDVLRRPPL